MTNENESWTDLVPTVAKPVVYAYKYRRFIQEYWKKAQVKVGLGKPSVIVTGRSGVGKSVLASHYHGEANTQDWNEPGTSQDVEIKPITIGDWTKIVAVIPGQNSQERSKALDEALNRTDELDGVIHVVDWGFTSIREAAVRKEMIESRGIDSIDKVREHHLNLELKDFELMLDKLAMSIANGRGPKWLVIAVNKVDLFETDLLVAECYYNPLCTSPFTDKINLFLKTVGANNIKIVHLPVCPMPEPFEWNGIIVAPQVDSITKQRNYLRVFIDKVSLIQNGVK
ncbi:GTPase domain-containing protein [Vibrio cyclitrophicus]|uniref:GTPase domain-containing protein n=1 Tax=Vibrio cyclitrophicus TaxID=47951 RepID=UPI000299E149|nr:GTPase domain-containing protein [Vibrio cyclitrophicus]NOH45846.1 GTPase domain-containing protein [Vibrio cyclitrophicus]OEE26640.1 hypothetical protein OAM_10430 [Vibrio cyclitrophicus ZF14]